MKKLLLLLSVLFVAFAASAGDLNPFAYNLKSTFDESTMTLYISFKVNAPAKSIEVKASDGVNEYTLYSLSNTQTKTEVNDLPINLLAKGLSSGTYTWRVVVTDNQHSSADFVSNANRLYHPSSIDIDNNPANRNFGTVFCIEASSGGRYNDKYLSHYNNDGAGLYVLNADGTARAIARSSVDGFGLTGQYDKERYGYNGGKDRNAPASFGSGYSAYSPYRVRVSKDGRIFITMLTIDGEVLYEAPQSTFSATNSSEWITGWKRVISCKDNNGNTNSALKLNDNKNLYTTSGSFVAGPNIGFDVRGSGSNLQLLMLSANQSAIVNVIPAQFYCREYNLGENTTWNKSPNRLIFDGYVYKHNTTQVQYDKNGNVYMCQRYPGGTGINTLMKFTVNRTNNTITSEVIDKDVVHRCGAMRFNKDFTKFAVATKGNSGKGGAVTIYPVDENGNPNFSNGTQIEMLNNVGYSMMDFAWDYADNLYIASDEGSENGISTGQCIAIYAMPNTNGRNVVSTPANTSFTIECVQGATYAITANSNNQDWGTVTMTSSGDLVGGKVPSCAEVIVTATPTEHHRFVEWKVGEETVSTDPTYSFYAIKDLTITAHFAYAKHKVTWNNLFMNGKDIGTENPHYPRINERLWRMFQARYKDSHPGDAGYKYSYLNDVFNLDSRKYVRTDNLLLVDINNEEAVKNSKDVGNFITSDPTFEWLGTYLKSHSTASWETDKAWVYHLFAFFNKSNKIYYNTETEITTYDLQCDYSKWGLSENWAPVWTEAVLGLPQTMAYGDYTPTKWNWLQDDENLFRGKWVNGWKDTSTDPETGEAYVQRPDAWYAFNTTRNISSTLTSHWGLGRTYVTSETHILAWRKDNVAGEIVTTITGDVDLHATYVEKKLEENDNSTPDLSTNPYDATNDDLIKLLNNKNYVQDKTKVPTHNLTVARKLQAGMYNTICLPLTSQDQNVLDLTTLGTTHPLYSDGNGQGATVLEFASISPAQNSSGEDMTILNFTQVSAMQAGKPYLVKLKDGAEDLITDMEFSTVSAYNELHPVSAEANGVTFTFVPTINPTEVPAGSLILVADNRLALTTKAGQMAGLRGYFTFSGLTTIDEEAIAEQAAEGRVLLSVKRPVTTSLIIAPDSEQQTVPQVNKLMYDGQIYIIRDNTVYTITGVRVK